MANKYVEQAVSTDDPMGGTLMGADQIEAQIDAYGMGPGQPGDVLRADRKPLQGNVPYNQFAQQASESTPDMTFHGGENPYAEFTQPDAVTVKSPSGGATPVSYQDLAAAFTPDELKDMMARANEMGLSTPEARNAFISYRLQKRKADQAATVAKVRGDPDFQKAVVEGQLPEGGQADLLAEAGGFLEGMAAKASPLVGGYGGSSTMEGELLDVKAAHPGADVRPVMMPSPTGEEMIYMVGDEKGNYKPVNAPGMSPQDYGNFVGDFFTLESVGSLLPFIGEAKRARLLLRAGKAALGAGTGGAADALIDPNEEKSFSIVASRMAAGASLAFVGEGLGDAAIAAGNIALGRGGVRAASEPTFKRAQDVQALGGPLYAGQVSPMSLAAIWRRRWGQYDPALREQVIQQNLWLGKRVEDATAQFRSADGVDQALLVGGLDPNTLDLMEQEFRASLQAKTENLLGVTGNDSMSRAGRNVQDALFGLNKDGASYRQLGQEVLNRREDEMLNIARDSGQFAVPLGDVKRVAHDELQAMPVIQKRPDQVARNLETNEDTLGAGVKKVRAKHDADLAFVLKTLDNLPEPSVLSRATYRVRVGKSGELEEDVMRVDGDGNLRVPYKENPNAPGTQVGYQGMGAAPGPAQSGAEGPVIGTYDLDGIEMIRMMRGKLRDFFGNPMIPAGSNSARVAKRVYGMLGDALEQVEGQPAFTQAVKKYNKSASNYLGTMERLQTAKATTEQDGQALVKQFTGGAMGFETLSTLKRTLNVTGERGARAWQGYRNAAARDILNNPEKVRNLAIDPKTTGLVFSPEEIQAFHVYGTAMQTLESQGFAATARSAKGARGRAMALFSGLPDETKFKALWGRMTDVDKNVMRVAVIEDLLQRSSGVAGGMTTVPSPAQLASNVDRLFTGDMAARSNLIFPPDTIKLLKDTETIAAFYKDVQGQADVGASLAASETAGAPQKILESGDIKRGILAFLPIRANQILANSMADGVLSKLLAPRLKEPFNPAKLHMFATMATTTLNNDAKMAGESSLDKAVDQNYQRAKSAALK